MINIVPVRPRNSENSDTITVTKLGINTIETNIRGLSKISIFIFIFFCTVFYNLKYHYIFSEKSQIYPSNTILYVYLLFYLHQLNRKVQLFSRHFMVCVKGNRCGIFFNNLHWKWLAVLI